MAADVVQPGISETDPSAKAPALVSSELRPQVRTRTPLDLVVGLLAVGCILLFQLLVGQAIGLGRSLQISRTAAIWLCLLVGNVLAVGLVMVYLIRSGRSPLTYLGRLRLKWWEATVVPLALVVLGQLLYRVGTALVGLLAPLGLGGGQVGDARQLLPHEPLEFALAALACLVAAGFGEEYLFRGYWLQTLLGYLPAWLAGVLVLLLFGSIHAIGFGSGGVLVFALWAVPVTAYVLRSGNLLPAIIAHALNDLLAYLVLLPAVLT